MMQQTAPRMEAGHETPCAADPGERASVRNPRRHKTRARVAGAVLAVGVASALAASAWGVFSSLSVEADPARVGEPVEVTGGLVRVDGVTPEHMSDMQSDKFAASGMNMSSMGMDMAPEGQRRFTANVSLASEDGPLSYSPEDFQLTGEGMEGTGPIRDALEGETVPAGGAVSGSMVFQVPEDAKSLELSFDEGRKIALDSPPATEAEGQDHDAPAKGENDDTSDGGHGH